MESGDSKVEVIYNKCLSQEMSEKESDVSISYNIYFKFFFT